MKQRLWIRNTVLFLTLLFLTANTLGADEAAFHGIYRHTLKVENTGTVSNLVDELGIWGTWPFSPDTRLSGRLEPGEFIPELSGSASSAAVFREDGFDRSFLRMESEVLRENGDDYGLRLIAAYGAHQEILTVEHTRFRFERSATSGIDGLNLAVSLPLGQMSRLTAAFNPLSLQESSAYPDALGVFSMESDLRGSGWGTQIDFISSTMQLFYDSSSNLEANPLFGSPNTGEAFTLGIGGTLTLEAFGIHIFGFGMTEYFLMYDRLKNDILQAQWCAGFGIPLLAGTSVNLSGSNAMVLGGGDGSYINFGLDAKMMITETFGLIGAAAALGLMDRGSASLEGGICFDFKYFSFTAGYSDHNIGKTSGYARGAFDRIGTTVNGVPGGGFFLTGIARF